jgi:peptidoglycan hydrolase-like protein with peptidoglycan-binding domain
MINYKLSALDHAMNIPGEYEAQIWLVDEQDVRQTVAQFKLSVTQNVHYMPWVTMSNDRDRIKETQRMLNLLGYRAGPIDGSLGNLTKTQLLRFQYEYMADVPIQDYVVSVNERLYNRLAHVIISLINHKTLPDRRTYAVGDIKISDTKQLGMMWVYLADSATTYNPERWRLINSGNDKQFIYGENFKTVVYLNQPLRTELAVTLAYANDAFYAKHCHHIIVSSGYRSAQTQKEIWGKRWVLYGNQYFQKLLPVIRTIESKLAANQTTITEANQYRSCLVEKILVIDGKSQSLIDRVELPGRSNHSGGRAIDISDYGDMRKKELLERYGFINHSAEKWHFNYVQ